MFNSEVQDSESVFADALVQVVASGSSLITELQRLSKRIPEVSYLQHFSLAFSARGLLRKAKIQAFNF